MQDTPLKPGTDSGLPPRPSSSGECRDIAVSLAAQARLSLCLFTPDLEPAIYDNQDFIAAVTRLVTAGSRSGLRILLQDSAAAARRGHRLIGLWHRLSSSIRIHQPGEEHRGITQAFLVADAAGYLHRPAARSYTGTATLDGPGRAAELLRLFDTVWDKSAPAAELQRLYL